MNLRLKRTLAELKKKNLEGLLIKSPANISYLIDFPSRDSCFLASKKGCVYFTDSRYTEEIKPHLSGIAKLEKIPGEPYPAIAGAALRLGLKKIGFEEKYFSYSAHAKLAAAFAGKCALVAAGGIVEGLRSIKEPQELEKIKKAVSIAASALEFAAGFIASGRKEIEIVGELERFIRYNGALDAAFDIIVASGPNSAFPHHSPGERKLKNNEPVLIDIGIDYCGYKSDLTRVFFLGKINSLYKKIYAIVRRAQERAIKKMRPGVPIAKVDAAARHYITREGYGGFFGHNLGHGIGLEVHESPGLSPKAKGKLLPGMAVTIEPAIYLPGKFGVRLEDMVLVTRKGCEVLSGIINK